MGKDRELFFTSEAVSDTDPADEGNVSKKSIFRLETSGFVPSYVPGDFLDEGRLNEEIVAGVRDLNLAQDKVSADLATIFKSPQKLQEHLQWRQKSQERVLAVIAALAETDSRFGELYKNAQESGQSIPFYEFYTYHLLQVGGEQLLGDILRQQLRYAQREGFEWCLKPYLEMQPFVFTGAQMSIRINRIALNDFMYDDQKMRSNLPSLFSFLVDSLLIRYQCNHEDVLKENQEGPDSQYFNLYPNRTKQAIEGATCKVTAMLGSSPELVDKLAVGNQGVKSEAAKCAKRLYRRVDGVRRDFYQVLLHPESPDFPAVKKVMEGYLRQGRVERLLALNAIELDEECYYGLYRKAREYDHDGPHAQFYEALANSVIEYDEEGSGIRHIPNIDDLSMVFNGDNTSEDDSREKVTFDDLKGIIREISNRSSVRDYNLKSGDIDWGRLVTPQSVTVKFGQDRPNKFKISFIYENEDGESLDIDFYYDTKREAFDWNIREAPSDPRLCRFRNSVFSVSRLILDNVKNQAQRRYKEKRLSKEVEIRPATPVKKVARERYQDEAYDLKRGARKQVIEDGCSSVSDTAFEDHEKDIKRIFRFPEGVLPEKILAAISRPDQPVILAGVERFNQDGVGELKIIRIKKQKKPPYYSLRINCSVHGGARVLARKVSSSDGVEELEVFDVVYRKDTFTKKERI